MISQLIGGFIAILIGISLIGTVSNEVNTATMSGSQLQSISTWGNTVLGLVPGFFALAIMGIGTAVIYSAMKESGIA